MIEKHNPPETFQPADKTHRAINGQTALEYLLLLGATVAVVLTAFQTLLPRATTHSNAYFRKVANGLMGDQAGRFVDSQDREVYKARTTKTNYP